MTVRVRSPWSAALVRSRPARLLTSEPVPLRGGAQRSAVDRAVGRRAGSPELRTDSDREGGRPHGPRPDRCRDGAVAATPALLRAAGGTVTLRVSALLAEPPTGSRGRGALAIVAAGAVLAIGIACHDMEGLFEALRRLS